MVQKQKILIVDDESDICDILHFNLTNAGFTAETANSAEQALSMGVANYDLLLLDVMMEGISGFQLARQLKADPATKHIPIIFLTAKDTENDTLQGFGLGADDYIRKPFAIREVVARIRAVLGRTAITAEKRQTANGNAENITSLSYEGLQIDEAQKIIIVDNQEVTLTRTEYDLLCCLLANRGKVLSRQQLIERVWRPDVVVGDRTVDVNITRMRKKIGRYGSHIVARSGFGYVFEV